jgi:pimeloyl-ACP methyl ester carboxylesterase
MKLPLSFRILRGTLRPLSYVAPTLVGSFWGKYFMETSRHKRPGWEQDLLARGEPLTLAGNIRAWSFGGSGPLVVLAHGWDGRGSQLGKFIGPLVERGFRVVAFDGPAHGDTPGTWTNLVQHARAMVALTDDLVSRFGPIRGVIGHSFGSAASVLAVTMGMDARKLVLIASPCSLQNVFDRYVSFVGMSPAAARHMQREIEEAVGYRVENLEVARMTERMPGVRALVFHDPADEEVPYSEAECIVRDWPAARLVRVEGVGHRRILKAAPVIAETVDFLSA